MQEKSIQNLTEIKPAWIPVPPDKLAAYEFRGDCILENEAIWLHVPRDPALAVMLAAKPPNASESVLPVQILGGKANATATRMCRVTELTNETALVTITTGEGGPAYSCRVNRGKYWMEVIPGDSAEQVRLETHAKFVVLPTEYGEDSICDAAWAMENKFSTVSLPRENMVIALEENNHHMCLLTFPSIGQAGELVLHSPAGENTIEKTASGNYSAAIVKSISAKFAGNSIFVSLLPQENLWYSEVVTKKYSAPGHIPIDEKKLLPGYWRIAGRIYGEKTGLMFYVSEDPSTNLLFECRQSGTLQSFFYFLFRPLEDATGGTPTPLEIYRETLGETEAAYLLQTEVAGQLFHRETKYRGVCGCVDDMKAAWRQDPKTLSSGPSYYTSQLDDCKTIIDHMDVRLHEYEQRTLHLGELLEQVDSITLEKGDTASQKFLSSVRKGHSDLKSSKLVRVEPAYKLIEEIQQKIMNISNKKVGLKELDDKIEKVRDVADLQEKQQRKFRGIYLELSTASNAYREHAVEPLKPFLSEVGHACRQLLRSRDRSE